MDPGHARHMDDTQLSGSWCHFNSNCCDMAQCLLGVAQFTIGRPSLFSSTSLSLLTMSCCRVQRKSSSPHKQGKYPTHKTLVPRRAGSRYFGICGP